ncbi:MAG: GDP-mannose 4,6-dehydratase [Myxococcota bacterium]
MIEAGRDSEHAAAYRGRRVLVTGADGFLGSHLCERLLGLGAHVSAVVRPSSVKGTAVLQLRNLAGVQSALTSVVATDVAGPDAVAAMAETEPEIVFHLAADAYVERSFGHPREVMRTNLGGTESVLELARVRDGVERVVVTSSSEIYGPAQTEAIDEGHPLQPTSPYAASKLAADRLAYAHHCTYGTPVAIIRPFNTFGPRHPYDVIPKFIERALAGRPLVVYGDGAQSRDFTYAPDMVEAFVTMGAHPAAIGRAVNFGTGVATTIAALARMIVAVAGSVSAIEHGAPRDAEVSRLCCDHGLATSLLGWRPRVNLAQGLADNVAWVRERR